MGTQVKTLKVQTFEFDIHPHLTKTHVLATIELVEEHGYGLPLGQMHKF